MSNTYDHALVRGASVLAAFTALGAIAAGCTKSTGSHGGETPVLAAQDALVSGKKKQATPQERAARDAAFKDLQERLKALEGQRTNVTSEAVRVAGDFTLPATLLGKELLWGSALQYAKVMNYEAGEFETSTVFALGTKIARFQRAGDTLLLLSRDAVDFESDYPAENILARFAIVSEAEGKLSLHADAVGMESARVIGEWVGSVPEGSAKAFVRSLEFDAKEDTLVFEITFRDASGAQFDFLESVQPRENVVGTNKGLEITEPASGKDNDPSDFATLLRRVGTFPITAWHAPEAPASEGDLSRVAKEKKSFVSRFNIEGKKEIAWWVTSNIPDTLLPEIKAGIEGWNRYFNEVSPDRKIMVFKGKLPESVKLGDPRYNVVLFDAVASAPAAYESQASDPLTGLQTQSLIYLPFAWYNISADRYLDGADDAALAGKGGKGKAAFLAALRKQGVIRCERPGVDMRDAVFMAQSRAADTADEAGRALIRSTLLHEVGHGLGMDHNFKGTLTGDIASYNETDWVYSSSTMDYNPFAMEDTLFVDLDNPKRDVTKGLRQPYDAQFIDIVYNQGKLTQARGEPAFPFCNDADHEDTINGVDPLCRQYDFFASPDQALTVPAQRLASDANALDRKLGGFVTLKGYLAQRAAALQAAAKGDTGAQDLLTDAQAVSVATTFSQELGAAFKHFLRTGSYSYVSALSRETRLLGEWKPVDGIEKGTEFSFHTGLEYAANFIKNLFTDSGSLRGEAYKAYERQVQSQLAARMAELFSTGYDTASNTFLGEGKVRSGVAVAKEAQSALFKSLLERVSAADKSAVSEQFDALEARADAVMDAHLSLASQRILDGLPTIVVSSDVTDSAVNGRPAVRGQLSHTLVLGLAALARRPSVAIATRSAAIDALLTEDANAARFAPAYKVSATADGVTKKVLASSVRAQAIAGLVAEFKAELAPLDKKVRTGRYLTADERSLHEFLKSSLAVFTDGAESTTGTAAR